MLDVDTISRDSDDTFKILIATDNHIGYNEHDPIRGEDSFNTFEEILQLAHEHNVDFILLGGDLFDANKPSQYCFHRTVELIRKYSFGSKKRTFEVVDNFNEAALDEVREESLLKAIPNLNFYDPNINISIPIFSIHGNHDDPTGMKSVSSLDTLAAMGLVNYIGRCDVLSSMEISPVILYKGKSELAIYGVGHLADKRFVRLHREHKISFNQVNGTTAFQLLMLHQNRANRGTLNYLPYTAIPKFMDLVMWGHEHDCWIEPTVTNNVYYTQPGSSVATSLSEGESILKKVGILYINQKHFQIEPIPLKTVRMMVYRQLTLDQPSVLDKRGINEVDLREYSEKAAYAKVIEMLEKIEEMKETQREKFGYENKMLPLLRLIVQYHDPRQAFNYKNIAMKFSGKVANPDDILMQKRIREKKNKAQDRRGPIETNLVFDHHSLKEALYYIKEALKAAITTSNVCFPSGFTEALGRYVKSRDRSAFSDYVYFRRDKFLKECKPLFNDRGDKEALMESIKEHIAKQNMLEEADEVHTFLAGPNRKELRVTEADVIDDDLRIESISVVTPPEKPARGRGSRGTKGSRGRAKKN